MELTAVDLGVRLVSGGANIKKKLLIAGKLSADEQQHALASIERLSRSRLHMVHDLQMVVEARLDHRGRPAGTVGHHGDPPPAVGAIEAVMHHLRADEADRLEFIA